MILTGFNWCGLRQYSFDTRQSAPIYNQYPGVPSTPENTPLETPLPPFRTQPALSRTEWVYLFTSININTNLVEQVQTMAWMVHRAHCCVQSTNNHHRHFRLYANNAGPKKGIHETLFNNDIQSSGAFPERVIVQRDISMNLKASL